MSDLVGNPKDRFSLNADHMGYCRSVLFQAMFDGEGPMLNYLEESGTEKLQTPLHIAAVNGHLEVVKVC